MGQNKTLGNEKIAAMFDAGTFVETGAYVTRADGNPVSVVCGYGAVNGKLAYAFLQDSDREKGAFDLASAKKIASLYELAKKNGAPMLGVFDSAGAILSDGASAMAAYGLLLKTVSDASGVIPQYALIAGVCAGNAATVASLFDVTVAIKGKSSMFVNAPFLIGREVGSAEYTEKTGLSSVVCENEDSAVAILRKLVALLPSNNEEGAMQGDITDDVNRTVDVKGLNGKELVDTLVDNGNFLEVGSGDGMLVGFANFGGVPCGMVANDSENGGVITNDGARRAAKLIRFCDAFSIPIVTLVDSMGVENGLGAEGTPLASQLGKLAMSYASADVAKITVITGKAYGAAFTLMGSKALGADMTFALPTSEISVMAPDTAVAFLWNDRIKEGTTRADLEAEWKKTQASAVAAAADGSIDDIINPAELRQRICSAVYMLVDKAPAVSDRKHCNLPL